MVKLLKLTTSNKAFSLFEILIILAIVGIFGSFAYVLYPKSNLNLASEQIIRHLQYTRFLALNSVKEITQSAFCQSDNCEIEKAQWQRSLWRLQFSELKNIGWSYSLFSDSARKSKNKNFDSRPMDSFEVARDLVDGKFLSVYTYNNSKFANDLRDGDLAITSRYGVASVEVLGCYKNRIVFDENGFLFCENPFKNVQILLRDNFSQIRKICIEKNGKIESC